jgi:protein-S-isoprenylcysteine O-methyltransferase Ste14
VDLPRLNVALRAHGYAVLVVGTFLVALPALARQLDGALGFTIPIPLAWAGYVLLPVAGSLSYRSFWLFMTRGEGTAFPTDPPQRLVILGPYRYVRNPMYLGNLGIVVAEGLALRSPGILLYAAMLSLVVHLYVTRSEEPALMKRYGDPYRRYMEAVRRWLPGPPISA